MESVVESGNYFTALLELPPNEAMELLTDDPPLIAAVDGGACGNALTLPAFPSNSALVARAAKYSVLVDPGNSTRAVKSEPVDSGSDPGRSESDKSVKRKDREKKGKSSNKKSKTTPLLEDGEKLPYVHVRARRGQATDSHSLAERARREKINARMKLLQELVPGCNKISGTSLVLDEIINHVQYLQRQVEYLSMRLAAVNPRIDFNLDSVISGSESTMDCNFPNMAMPLMWPEFQINGERQEYPQQWQFESLSQPVWVKEENHSNLITSENSLLSYDSPANSASLHSSQLKMEL
ncbi:hypothetical protein RND81_05G165400 [Saponaria officinalis]|uniref:BHLH domain-containing protein n=1 Tax=Saponaria officinalis TaxID=3572 RepID=A0AAW1L1Q3_SAPOF